MVEISVIIPTYNRGPLLLNCLQALIKQDLEPSQFEVIVIIDGSTDNTESLLASQRWPYHLIVQKQANQGQNVARNVGVEAASGRYCLFIDDDIIASPRLLSSHLNVLRSNPDSVGIGQITLHLAKPISQFCKYYAKGWHMHYEKLRSAAQPSWQDCFGGNLSLARQRFLEVGGFASDLRHGEDIELGYRLGQNGATFLYVPEAVGCQFVQRQAPALIRDAVQHGTALVAICEKQPILTRSLLGHFADAGRREVVFRKMLLKFRLPGFWLLPIGHIFSNQQRKEKWYRFILSYSYWLGVRKAIRDHEYWRRLSQGTRILMYHAFTNTADKAHRYVMMAKKFRWQMAWLKFLKYNVLTLDEFCHLVHKGIFPPSRTIVLTIDDGFADVLEFAVPILRRYKFQATIFVVSQRIGQSDDWSDEPRLRGRQLLAQTDISRLIALGFDVGGHSRTHPHLPNLTESAAKAEIAGCRIDLKEMFNKNAALFAYPFGEFCDENVAQAEEAGFQAACTVDDGYNTLATPPFRLRRQEVIGTDSLLQFIWKLW